MPLRNLQKSFVRSRRLMFESSRLSERVGTIEDGVRTKVRSPYCVRLTSCVFFAHHAANCIYNEIRDVSLLLITGQVTAEFASIFRQVRNH